VSAHLLLIHVLYIQKTATNTHAIYLKSHAARYADLYVLALLMTVNPAIDAAVAGL